MEFIKNHITDILGFTGLILISVGLFILNIIVGLIGTGVILIVVAYLISKGGV